ncbi:MAG: cupin domain-containing protein [Candidatus Jordarchaeaceae archaeon]
MIVRSKEAKTVEMFEGVSRKTLAIGEKMLLAEFTFRKGAIVPSHTHPHEQVGYVVKGKVNLRIGEQKYLLGAGDSYYIKPNVDHSAELIEESVIIDVFCPPREDYK